MTRGVWLVLTALLAGSILASPAWAQDPPAHFQAALQSARASLDQIEEAMQTGNATAARAILARARVDLVAMQASLEAALASARNDEERSRAEGLLNHVNAGLASLDDALAGPDDTLFASADAARGEINEALNELFPVAGQAPISPGVQDEAPQPSSLPAQLPQAGEPLSAGVLIALAVASAALVGGGLALRRVG